MNMTYAVAMRRVKELESENERLRAFASDMVGYLEMKLAGFRQDYPEEHCMVQTCIGKLAAARAALEHHVS